MRIDMLPTVSFDDIEAHFGWGFNEVSFTQCIENGTYVLFSLDEDAISEREEEMQEMKEFGDTNHSRYMRLKNELTLIHYFRNLGYTDAILICVVW